MTTPTRPQYEFDPEQNALIGSLAAKMRFVGLVLIALGVLALLGSAATFRDVRDGNLIIFGLLQVIIGVWTRSAASSFRQVVETKGSDITHLMDALDDLRKLYALQYWLVILAAVLLVVSLVAAEIFLRGQAL
jgi:hypothetical protein